MPVGRKKGTPKTGGRQKGTTNKLSTRTREQLWDYCQSKKVNPFEHAVDVLAGEVEGAELQHILDCAKDLRGYLLPKLKAIDHVVEVKDPVKIEVELSGPASD